MKSKQIVPYLQLIVISVSFCFAAESPDIFVGPFPSWLNVKTLFSATGNGTTDDWRALQNALDSAGRTGGGDQTITHGGSRTIYLPAGTYKISQTLVTRRNQNLRIEGAHPDSVLIIWAGLANGDMFQSISNNGLRIGRITWDGAGTANRIQVHCWNGYASEYDWFPYGLEVHDQIFKNAKIGIGAGGVIQGVNNTAWQTTLSQGSIVRCTFKNMTQFGIKADDMNTGNVFVRHCLFEDCATAYTSIESGIYNCIFRRSTVMDISGICWQVAVRHCYSVGSRRFIEDLDGMDGRQIFLDGNTIIDPTIANPINIPGTGQHVVFDNTIRSLSTTAVPVIKLGCNSNNFLMGNTFTIGTTTTAVSTCATGSPGHVIDNQVVAASVINATEPVLPSTPKRYTGTVYEPTAFTSTAIQAAIISAATNSPGVPSVVYLKAGTYAATSTIVIPKAARICVMGEGGTGVGGGQPTIVNWTATSAGPVFKLLGPSYASMADIKIMGGDKAQAILVDNADQPGGRVLTFAMNAFGAGELCKGYMTLVDGLDYTNVEAWDYMMSSGDNVSARVIGGPLTAGGQATTAGLNLWGTGVIQAISTTIPYWDVQNGGRLIMTDNWGEVGGPIREPYVNLTSASSGSLTIQGYKIQYHTTGVGTTPTLIFNGFSGKATILGLIMNNGIVSISGSNSLQNVLLACIGFDHSNMAYGSSATITATAGTAVITNSGYDYPNNIINGGDTSVCTGANKPSGCYGHSMMNKMPDMGSASDDWYRGMMAQARSNHPSWNLDPTPDSTTDVKLWRLTFSHFINGIQIRPCTGANCPPISVLPNSSTIQGNHFNQRTIKMTMPGNRVVLSPLVKHISMYDVQGKTIYSASISTFNSFSKVKNDIRSMHLNSVVIVRTQE